MEPQISLQRNIEILWRRRYVVMGAVLLIATAMGVYSFTAPSVYEGTALLLATPPTIQVGTPPDPRIPGLKVGGILGTELPVSTLVAFAKSETVVRQLAAKVLPGPDPARGLGRRLTARAVRNTDLLELRVRGRDPAWVARAANVWATVIIAGSEGLFTSGARQSLAFFDKWLRENAAQLGSAEENLRKFNAASKIGLLQARVNALTSQTAAFQSRVIDLSITLQRAETELAQIETQIRRQPRIVTLSKSITTDPFLQQAAGAVTGRDFAEVSRLRLKNEELNPVYVALDQARANAAVQVAALRAERDRLVQAIAQSTGELSELRGQLAAQQLQQTQLVRAADNSKQVYDVALQRREEARVGSVSQSSFVRLAAQAEVPYEPVAPRKILNMALGAMLGLVLGVLLAFGLEFTRAGAVEDASGRIEPAAAEPVRRRKAEA